MSSTFPARPQKHAFLLAQLGCGDIEALPASRLAGTKRCACASVVCASCCPPPPSSSSASSPVVGNADACLLCADHGCIACACASGQACGDVCESECCLASDSVRPPIRRHSREAKVLPPMFRSAGSRWSGSAGVVEGWMGRYGAGGRRLAAGAGGTRQRILRHIALELPLARKRSRSSCPRSSRGPRRRRGA